MLKKTLFNSVIYRGTLASIYGIVAGLLLSLLIWAILNVMLVLGGSIITPALSQGVPMAYSSSAPPFEFFVTMGMGFGAVIGAIFGSITGLREDQKKK